MTGKELIIYILSNNLEDEPVVKDGIPIGFMLAEDVAKKMNVGIATVCAWLVQGQLPSVLIGNTFYIPANFESPLKGATDNE